MEKKYFMWYDSDTTRGGQHPIYGPHYYFDEQIIGKAYYHSLDDLMKTSISDSIKKRLRGAKIGTKIKVHYLHSNGNLMLMCISEKQIELLKTLDVNNKECSKLKKRLYQIEHKSKEIISMVMK